MSSALILSFSPVFLSSARFFSYDVLPDDSWNYTVQKAYRDFEYSVVSFNNRITSRGYLHGDVIVAVGEQLELTVLSYNSNSPESINYQIKAENETLIIENNAGLFDVGVQEALGCGILGEGEAFLQNNSGLTVGNAVFIAPSNISWSSVFQLWNKSIPELQGSLEGIETIRILDEQETSQDYKMWIQYIGTMANNSIGLDLDFTYDASFHWEKKTGVLLSYDITTKMMGEYNNAFSAKFNMELRLDREDLGDFMNDAVPSFEIGLIIVLFTLIVCISRLRRIYLL
jgi:hypothetical protein